MLLKTFANSFKDDYLETGVLEYYDGEVTSYPSTSVKAVRGVWLSTAAVSYDTRTSSGWYLKVGASSANSEYASGSLVDPITTLTEVSKSIVNNTNDIMKSLTVAFQNNTENSVTVREIGLGINISVDANTHAVTSILARKVLNNAITIYPGEIYSFTYQIGLSMEDEA